MALTVYLQKDAHFPKRDQTYFLSFEDDGYYWFLFDFFNDLAKKSGQVIDLYDDAFFNGENLDLLAQTIQQAKRSILEKPAVWEEFTGTTLEKGVKTKAEKIFSAVNKKELESILDKLEKAIIEARGKNTGIFFCGD